MAKKRIVLDETSRRVEYLCHKLWNGSPTRMAKEIGVTPSAITNVTSGRQLPGRQLLAAIAADKRVNASWLLTGEGTPLGDAQDSKCMLLPVSSVLLASPPPHDSTVVIGHRFSTGHSIEQSCYWYRSPEDDTSLQTRRGDLILIDNAVTKYAHVEEAICVLSHNDGNHGEQLSLVWASPATVNVSVSSGAAFPPSSRDRKPRLIRRSQSLRGVEKKVAKSKTIGNQASIGQFGRIVGVCLSMLREYIKPN